jgi:cell division protein FtsW|tara:strand:- start:5287 stop:6411 length:1125 start_codon:yes stop_codon:yes gene_type:complete
MSLALSRNDTSVLGRWWWTVDRVTLTALFALMVLGAFLIATASPAVSERIGLGSFSLTARQLILLPPAAALMIAASLLSPRWIRRLAAVGFLGTVVLLIATLVIGTEIKGSTRWINFLGFSLQPSEFAKPLFAVVAAWMFAAGKEQESFPGTIFACLLWLLMVTLLLLQPDLGQTVVISAIFGVQFFLAGLPLALVIGLMLLGVSGLVGTYFLLPHVAKRIDAFLDPAAGDQYQIQRSLEAFMKGGLFGRGPGEGRVKEVLPDAHSDFIFAVAGEELGMIASLIIVSIFALVVLRGFTRLMNETNLFVLLAATGLLTQFGLQAFINMASSLQLIPTKGMTLPFLSFGGSSLIALALGMGMVLALTRVRVGSGEE